MVAVLEHAMLNSHPVIDAFAYRRTRKKNKDRAAHHGGIEASEGEGEGDGEDIPGGGAAPATKVWRPLWYYEVRAWELKRSLKRTREETLKDIRHEAFLVDAEEGIKGTFQPHLGTWRAKAKGKNSWLNLNDNMFDTKSGIAQAIYNAHGKDWRKHVSLRPAMRRERKRELHCMKRRMAKRDRPWKCTEPNLAALAALHSHTREGDEYIRRKKSRRAEG